ncbi:MAG: SWIM zinc finger family protein [Bacillota bacterium]
MNLVDFENYIDDRMLSRGWEYYKYDHIRSITAQDDTTYMAVVSGSEDYNVVVELSDSNEILFSECDCPFDLGPYCKHEAAVFYALRKMQSSDPNRVKTDSTIAVQANEIKSTKKSSSAKESPYDRFVKILSSQSKEKLVQFLTSLSLEYDEIGHRVEFQFNTSNAELERKNCIELIRSYIRQHSDRHGFIPYGEIFGATEGARVVFDRAEQSADDRDYERALEIYLCIIHEMVPLLQSADDSDGYIGGIIEDSIAALAELADNQLPEEVCEHFFTRLLKESSNKIYDDWSDWRLDLLEICCTLAVTTERREILEEHLDVYQKTKFVGSWSSQYEAEKITMMRYQLILNFEGQDKAENFIGKNIKYPSIREMAIREALSRKEYGQVEKLTLDGERHDKGLYGLIHKWKEFRYEAYRLSGQLEKQRSLAMEFILDGSFDYYKKLKATYSKEAWAGIYPGIIKDLEEQRGYARHYTDILIEEKEMERLLAYVKKTPAYIVNFYKQLLPLFPGEVYSIFVQHIYNEAKLADNRRKYQDVCSRIRLLAKAGGKEHAREVISTLLTTYPRKPAFREELMRIT